jgi:hypothetical protein
MLSVNQPQETNPHVEACRTVAWLIAANKPVYPVYVWLFVGSGVEASTLTALSLPLWVALGAFGARFPLSLRVGVPLLGALDTMLSTKLFGAQALTELFFAPCALLAIVSFRATEAWITRSLIGALFVLFVALHGRYGAPLHIWSETELASLANINAFAVASLTAFLGWRLAGLERTGQNRRSGATNPETLPSRRPPA